MLNPNDPGAQGAPREAEESASAEAEESAEAGAPHDGYRVVEPLRPDLRPGESVTWVPEQYCQRCNQARGTKKCPICGDLTVERSSVAEVNLPDMPAGAALALELEHGGQLEESTAVQPVGRRVLAEAPPPDDGDFDPPGEQPDADPPPAAPPSGMTPLRPRGLRPTSLLGRALEQREAQERIEAEARQREQARQQQNRPAFLQSTGTNGAHQSASEQRRSAPPPSSGVLDFRGRSGSPSAGGRRGAMQQRNNQRVQYDDSGREEHRTMGRGGKRKTAEQSLLELWEKALIDKPIWSRFVAAAISAGNSATDAANIADAAYMEMIEREHIALER